MRIASVVVAAGEGRRLGAAGPKAFVSVAGRPLLLRAVEALAATPDLVAQVVVVPPGTEAAVRTRWGEDLAAARVTAVVAGGARRQDSVAAGVAATPADADVVLVHDAARPLARAADARRVAEAAAREGAALLAVAVTDTLKRATADGLVAETLPREGLWRAQTPQGARRALLVDALARAAREGTEATDEAALLERAGVPVAIVPGDPANLKVTEPGDLRLVEAILAARAAAAAADVVGRAAAGGSS